MKKRLEAPGVPCSFFIFSSACPKATRFKRRRRDLLGTISPLPVKRREKRCVFVRFSKVLMRETTKSFLTLTLPYSMKLRDIFLVYLCGKPLNARPVQLLSGGATLFPPPPQRYPNRISASATHLPPFPPSLRKEKDAKRRLIRRRTLKGSRWGKRRPESQKWGTQKEISSPMRWRRKGEKEEKNLWSSSGKARGGKQPTIFSEISPMRWLWFSFSFPPFFSLLSSSVHKHHYYTYRDNGFPFQKSVFFYSNEIYFVLSRKQKLKC